MWFRNELSSLAEVSLYLQVSTLKWFRIFVCYVDCDFRVIGKLVSLVCLDSEKKRNRFELNQIQLQWLYLTLCKLSQPLCTKYSTRSPEVFFIVSKPNALRNTLCALTSDFGPQHRNAHLALCIQEVIYNNLNVSTTAGRNFKTKAVQFQNLIVLPTSMRLVLVSQPSRSWEMLH